MPKYTTSDIRNIVMAGHAGVGKTSLVEAMLHASGAIGYTGSVEKGDTTCDFSDEEKDHGRSLVASVVHCDHAGKHINVVDTPGSPDFIGHAVAAMPSAETMVILVDAVTGIESVTRRMMDRARERNLCRMIVINKIDAENIDLEALVGSIQETFGRACLPINLPSGSGSTVIDVFNKAEGEADFGSVADAHTAIVDQVVEVDEQLMETYLEQGELNPDQLHASFEKALCQGHLVPICFSAARPHADQEQPVGVEAFLDVVVNLLPNPVEGNPHPFQGDGEDPVYADPDPEQPVLAHVFQVRIDPFVGKLCMFRVHRGTVTKDTQLYIDGSKRPFKVGHLFKLQGAKHEEIPSAIPGDIAAVAKVEEVRFNAVLQDTQDGSGLHLLPLTFPEPMQGLAISPNRRGDEQKIADAISKFQEEDPCFNVTRDSVTKETVIHGLGELHLRVILEKLKSRFNVEVETKPPKIAYRETITSKAEGHHRHKKQTGGAGQFGEVFLRVEPMERGSGFEFSNDIFGGSIPSQFIPAVEKGVNQALAQGAIAGYPIQDIKVSLYDGKHHPVDSKEVAFVTAGKRAFIDAVQKAKPVLLEPMVNIEVTIPNEFMGDIAGDLSGKRGRIQGTDMLPGAQALIQAVVPLAEVSNYQSQLKSVTGGQGSFTMEFDHFGHVPSHVQKNIVAEYKPKESDE